jgi:TusA-related sulfurtransferase
MSHPEDSFPIAARIDTRGQSAAWCILCAERALGELEPGQVLEVLINDPQLAIDLPRVLSRRGNSLVATRQREGELQLYMRRGGGQRQAGPGLGLTVAPGPAQEKQSPSHRRQSMSQLLTEIPESASTVDARGSACPGPLLEAKKAIATVMVGQVLEVLSNDPGTKDDIPVWATKVGHEYLGHAEADGYERIFVRRQK